MPPLPQRPNGRSPEGMWREGTIEQVRTGEDAFPSASSASRHSSGVACFHCEEPHPTGIGTKRQRFEIGKREPIEGGSGKPGRVVEMAALVGGEGCHGS